MNDEEAVEPQEYAEPMDQMMEQQEADINEPLDNEQINQSEKTMIPLSVAQKLRQQKKELELELQWERQRYAKEVRPVEPIDDSARYESATKEDLSRSQDEAIRMIEERMWIKNNPEKYERINEFLPNFLKQRPNLASAINLAANRYEEAYTLMDALTPKQQQQIRQNSQPKKEAPNAPGGIPKAAVLNESIDVMNMSDKEFADWKASKRKRR